MGRGPSINLYHRSEIVKMCKTNFTIACNDAGLDFPCDVICATDPDWIKTHIDQLKRAHKPIITRKWEHLIDLGLDLIELPNDITNAARLTGAVAAKIGDTLAAMQGTKCYVFGLDHDTKGHYDQSPAVGQPLPEMMSQYAYTALNCRNIINMSPTSQITCWKKSDKLPMTVNVRSIENRRYDIQFMRKFIKEMFYCEVKR
jgi:hypothetical protein